MSKASPDARDSPPGGSLCCLHLLIGFGAVAADHGRAVCATGGMGPLARAQGNPAPDACRGL
ncbi:MAG: hypothetical protein INF48_01640 [Rhodobacter sp.]|nr:hypothetical protein [Rhodobacter sp.]